MVIINMSELARYILAKAAKNAFIRSKNTWEEIDDAIRNKRIVEISYQNGKIAELKYIDRKGNEKTITGEEFLGTIKRARNSLLISEKIIKEL